MRAALIMLVPARAARNSAEVAAQSAGQSGNASRPVRHLGARPAHPLAGNELGLLWPPAEGPDGRHRATAGLGYRLEPWPTAS